LTCPETAPLLPPTPPQPPPLPLLVATRDLLESDSSFVYSKIVHLEHCGIISKIKVNTFYLGKWIGDP